MFPNKPLAFDFEHFYIWLLSLNTHMAVFYIVLLVIYCLILTFYLLLNFSAQVVQRYNQHYNQWPNLQAHLYPGDKLAKYININVYAIYNIIYIFKYHSSLKQHLMSSLILNSPYTRLCRTSLEGNMEPNLSTLTFCELFHIDRATTVCQNFYHQLFSTAIPQSRPAFPKSLGRG